MKCIYVPFDLHLARHRKGSPGVSGLDMKKCVSTVIRRSLSMTSIL